jgi:hypothetical protein
MSSLLPITFPPNLEMCTSPGERPNRPGRLGQWQCGGPVHSSRQQDSSRRSGRLITPKLADSITQHGPARICPILPSSRRHVAATDLLALKFRSPGCAPGRRPPHAKDRATEGRQQQHAHVQNINWPSCRRAKLPPSARGIGERARRRRAPERRVIGPGVGRVVPVTVWAQPGPGPPSPQLAPRLADAWGVPATVQAHTTVAGTGCACQPGLHPPPPRGPGLADVIYRHAELPALSRGNLYCREATCASGGGGGHCTATSAPSPSNKGPTGPRRSRSSI